MVFLWTLVGFAILVIAVLYIFGYFRPEPKTPQPKDGWWGRGPEEPDADTSIREFKVSVSDEELEDLKRRLESARYGEDLMDVQFQNGFPVREMKKVVEYWKNDYNWRDQEAKLNSFPQFKTSIEGIDVHFLRVKPTNGRKGKPLLISHGWPGSIWEFYKMIPMLTDPAAYGGRDEDAFEVIVPSIPGFGFSEAPPRQGFERAACAGVFVKLMKRLGHDRFYAQGGDWGALTTTAMAQIYPENIIGYHNNFHTGALFNPRLMLHQVAAAMFPKWVLGEEHYKHFTPMWKGISHLIQETGYLHLQSTKPETIGLSLNDSPIGLAAYILEKFSTWTNKSWRDLPDGGLCRKFTMDELLTQVMIYWISGNVDSTLKFCKENFSSTGVNLDKLPVKVPVGLAVFPEEISIEPKPFAEYKFKDIVQYSYMSRGGHFAAFEEPELLAQDIFSFIRKLDARGLR